MRAAIYARYSSENQRETSIEDQTRICRDRAGREGWTVVATFCDREISAATPTLQRPGGREMLKAAGIDFDVLVIEALDRCWRDIVDQERTIRRLEFGGGVRIIGASDGYDSRHEDRELQRGVRGLLNQQYLRDLAKKTHRGQTGQVLRGYHAGGMPYGYRPVRDEHGSKLAVHEPEAKWVRWIFERYAEGWSVQRVAYALNEQSAPAPRARSWAVSAIYGSPAKGTGILNNVAYRGCYTWNKSRWEKDPETGLRKRWERPAHEWRTEERPELRIVEDALWQAVRDRMDAPRAHGGRGIGRRPSTLFGGLLRCGICGGSMVAVNKDSYGCAAAKDRGPTVCAGTLAPRKATDARLLSVVHDQLLAPEALAALQADIKALAAEQARATRQDDPRARLAVLDGEIRRLVEAIATVGVSPALTERLRAAEAERAQLQRRSARPQASDALARDVVAAYRRIVMQLSGALTGALPEARKALAEAFGDIRINRTGPEVYATFQAVSDRLLLAAAGEGMATVDNGGSGGGILHLSTVRIK